mmetsp:Transcript_55805/g.154495  ORF Transcript_55805/g.154495 Transcript_55805/m.154495 type:complete len:294 (+) Transcript_55805:59-940(+)|eukprot:CAMPEP_0179077862 /NCGR_PEP_ID=MMETSP0796-20121207/34831_1 /TAXON_ID=73915 /ORGANISM="Pyrodinium bahamense, Strain pbaha01" /LENGTH=293 /DNA_ID=CAMNT_0020775151 /DNA_START=59 /DNA_END=940 /DNA_ORIENTATION=-
MGGCHGRDRVSAGFFFPATCYEREGKSAVLDACDVPLNTLDDLKPSAEKRAVQGAGDVRPGIPEDTKPVAEERTVQEASGEPLGAPDGAKRAAEPDGPGGPAGLPPLLEGVEGGDGPGGAGREAGAAGAVRALAKRKADACFDASGTCAMLGVKWGLQIFIGCLGAALACLPDAEQPDAEPSPQAEKAVAGAEPQTTADGDCRELPDASSTASSISHMEQEPSAAPPLSDVEQETPAATSLSDVEQEPPAAKSLSDVEQEPATGEEQPGAPQELFLAAGACPAEEGHPPQKDA